MTRRTVNARCICTTVQNVFASNHYGLYYLYGELIIAWAMYWRSSTELEVSFRAFIDREFANCHENRKFTSYDTGGGGGTRVSTGRQARCCYAHRESHSTHIRTVGQFTNSFFLSKTWHDLISGSCCFDIVDYFYLFFKIDCVFTLSHLSLNR